MKNKKKSTNEKLGELKKASSELRKSIKNGSELIHDIRSKNNSSK